jgi:SH3-like domain-containing protein
MQKILTAILLVMMLTFSIAPANAQETPVYLRFAHTLPGVNAIDVYVNDSLSVVDLAYGEATTYFAVPDREINLSVALSGTTDPLWEQAVTVRRDGELTTPVPGDYVTLVVSSTENLAFEGYVDDVSSLSLGSGRFIVIHALETAPSVDVVIDDVPVLEDLGYQNYIAGINAPAKVYQFSILPADGGEDEALISAPVSINSLTSHVIIAYGTVASPEVMVLSAPTQNTEEEVGFVRLMHAIPEAPSVEILVEGTVLLPALAYGEASEHLALPAGSYEVTLRNTETEEDLATASLTVVAGTALTAVATLADDEPSVVVFNDPIGAIDSRSARVNVINTTAQEVQISLGDEAIAEDLAAGASTDAVEFDPIVAALSVTVGDEDAVEGEELTFYGGVYYNLFVLADGTVLVAPTALDQRLDSAPGSDPAVVAVEPTAVPTTAPTEASAANTPEASPIAPVPTIVAVTPVPTATTPTARVVLDPGANLQLREYPSSDARSLGLAPSGSVLIVNGREGAPVDIDGNEIPLESGEDWIDPATLLESEDADLVPSETWLNITFATPDGGSIIAWVNSLYLDVDDARGFVQRLADLPTVPRNQPGEAVATSVTPPPVRTEVAFAIVIGLDTGVNLNIRRTAESTGEILARVVSGGELELVGIGESGDWAFVRYRPIEGGVISGWASTQYLRYEFNGRGIDIEEMQTRNLLEEVDEETLRGEISQDAPGLTQPTENPFRDAIVATVVGLNEGVALNLRRTPTQQAEVLANIPLGTRMVVLSRNLTGDWLQVEYDGVQGWVFTQYTALSFNDRSFSIDDVPFNDGLSATGTAVLTTPTATPAP